MQSRSRMWITAALAVGCSLAMPLSAPAAAQADAPFAEEIHVFAVEDESAPPPRCATLFVGSSSIRFWFGLANDFRMPLVKRGFGGSTVADVNRYFDRIVAPYHPRRIVFYAGENDIAAGKPAAQVFADFEEFLKRKDASLGTTPVFYVSAKPSPSRLGQLGAQRELNGLVEGLAARRSDLVFVDVASAMMVEGAPRPEIYISDHLHMNRAGYAIWTRVIGKALKRSAKLKAPGC